MGCVKSKPIEGAKSALSMGGSADEGNPDENDTILMDDIKDEAENSSFKLDVQAYPARPLSMGGSAYKGNSDENDAILMDDIKDEAENSSINLDVQTYPTHPPEKITLPESEKNHSNRTVLSDLMDSINQDHSFEHSKNCVQVVISDKLGVEDVYDGIHDGPILGYGISGVVRKIVHKETLLEYAVKAMPLSHMKTEDGLRQLREELTILLELDHPNIVKLEAVYESKDSIFLVQELCRGGDLFDRLDEQPDEHYSEDQCARLVKQMLAAVRYIHSKGIIHRDLKLENFLFDTTQPDAELKMIDFGLSKHFQTGESHHEPVGTRYTVAPEVLMRTYDEKVDIWAIGVITFLLLSGESPFGGCCVGDSNAVVKDNILNARYSFEPEEYWEHVSDDAKAFISMILVLEPGKRPNAHDCQQHTWMHDMNVAGSKALRPNVVDALRSFREFSDLRRLLCEVIGFTLLPEQILDLRKEFEKLDVEGSGEITLKTLKQVLMEQDSGSVRNLTVEEVEDIFNSMRMHKEDTTVHWHHFLAAGLSECPVDERNHRLAFERLDNEKKGYITLNNILELMGPQSLTKSEESLQSLWADSTEIICRTTSKIQYDDFVKIMAMDDDDDIF